MRRLSEPEADRRGPVARFLLGRMEPGARADAERHSRLWMADCKACGRSFSIWDLGGVRYRAYGRPWKYVACPYCAKRDWRQFTWRGESPELRG